MKKRLSGVGAALALTASPSSIGWGKLAGGRVRVGPFTRPELIRDSPRLCDQTLRAAPTDVGGGQTLQSDFGELGGNLFAPFQLVQDR